MDEQQRPPSFQFYPRDFLSSRAVCLMSPEARGGYITLLCHAWMSDEPGVLDDDDAALAVLSGLGDRWSACAASIRRAFRATSREGRRVLVQDRMVNERGVQAARYRQAGSAGLRSARMREARRKGTHSEAEWAALVFEFGGRCVRCWQVADQLQKDHIVPVYQGGSDAIEKIQPLCLGPATVQRAAR